MKDKQDEKVLQLMKIVEEKKTKIASAGRPQWKTSCALKVGVNERKNIQVETSLPELISLASFVKKEEYGHMQACMALGVVNELLLDGYTVGDWITDIKTRISQVQISSEKKNLAALEKQLAGLVSEGARREIEIEELEKLLAQ